MSQDSHPLRPPSAGTGDTETVASPRSAVSAFVATAVPSAATAVAPTAAAARMQILTCLAVIVIAGCGAGQHSEETPSPATDSVLNSLPNSAADSLLPAEPLFRDWPGFHDVARPHVSSEQSFEMPGIMGSGCSMVDLNGDDRLDLILVAGDRLTGDSLNDDDHVAAEEDPSPDRATARHCRVLTQLPEGRFSDVSQQAAIMVRGFGMGAFSGDIDNDGDPDILTTSASGTLLYRNDGDLTFTNVTNEAGLTSSRWATAGFFFDFDRDGWLDLLVVNYVDFFPGSICTDSAGRRDYCGPQSFQGTTDLLYHNLGAAGAPGTFENVTVTAGLGRTHSKGLGALCADFNGDRRPDIYIACDMEPNLLWIQNADGSFTEEASLRGCAVDLQGRPQASMGTSWSDFDHDERFDLFLTHLRGETNTLYCQPAEGVFIDQTAFSGLGELSLSSTGFGIVRGDLDLDGEVDLAVANGRVMRAPQLQQVAAQTHWQDYAEHNQLFLSTGELRFQILPQGSDPFTRPEEPSRGLAAGDVDNDGDLDLLVSSVAAAPRLYENTAVRKGHWLSLKLRHPDWNRDAIGARVTVSAGGRRRVAELLPNAGYLSSHEPRLHFGLGSADTWDFIDVQWPDDETGLERFGPGKANQSLVLEKGRGTRLVPNHADGDSR